MDSRMALFVCLAFASYGHSLRQDFPWTISLTVSSTPGAEYEGEVEVLAIFKDGVQHATVFPTTKYSLGAKYVFHVRLMSSGSLEAVYIRTRGFCPLGLLPHDVLRLSHLSAISRPTNTVYSKHLGDLAIKDACQMSTTQGTSITDFDESISSSCVADNGQIYDDGDQFDIGCSGRCKCENGSVACVDMCAAIAWGPDQKCHFVHVPGQCCDQVVCEDGEKSTCQEPTIANVEADGKATVAVRRYPWAVMYCMDSKCKQLHGGVIIGDRHILTFAPDLSTSDHLLVASGEYIIDQTNTTDFKPTQVANISVHSDFINPDSPIADSASRLQVVEFQEPFTFTKTLQSVNLPFNLDHCTELSKDECPLRVVGWDRTDGTDDEFKQWFLHADQVKKDESLCVANSTRSHPRALGPRRRGAKRSCVGGLIREDCTGPLGGSVIASSSKVDFVVGLTDPDSALFRCEHPGTSDVLPLCKYLDWIQEIMNIGI